jgi:hypothetical protein
MASKKAKTPKTKPAKSYKHPEWESPMRTKVGTQAQFKKKLPSKTYRYDSSLSPALNGDGQNPTRMSANKESLVPGGGARLSFLTPMRHKCPETGRDDGLRWVAYRSGETEDSRDVF